jgi:uncharacterized protein YndB with AHSA1/START domain
VKITVETAVKAPLDVVWSAWSDPEEIKRWNTPTDEWHTTRSTVDLRDGGRFCSRMETKSGSAGFDFEGTYTRVVPQKSIDFRMDDGRTVSVEFIERPEDVVVKQTFDAETVSTLAIQRMGWQAILDNFGRHVEARRANGPGTTM